MVAMNMSLEAIASKCRDLEDYIIIFQYVFPYKNSIFIQKGRPKQCFLYENLMDFSKISN